MKLQSKIIIIQLVLLIVFVTLFSIISSFESRKNKYIHHSLEEQLKEAAKGVMKLKSDFLFKTAYDYTYWDDMVEFIKHPDTVWAKGNLVTIIKSLGFHYVMVYNPDRQLIYKTTGEAPLHGDYPEISQSMFNRLHHNRSIQFYHATPDGIAEFVGATVHRTADPQKKENPLGYFFLGHFWDTTYFKDLEDITNTKVTLIKKDNYVEVEKKKIGIISYDEKLFGTNYKLIGTVNFSTSNIYLEAYDKLYEISTIVFIAFSLIIFITISLFLQNNIKKPLKLISLSLNNENDQLIQGLSYKRDEFGQIANLIINFFHQKELLENENQERKISEENLRKSEKRFKETAELIPEIVFETKPNGDIVFVSKAAFELTGYTAQDLEKGINAFAMIPDEYKGIMAENLEKIRNNIPVKFKEYPIIKKDGSTFMGYINTSAIFDHGEFIGYRGTITDITVLKEKEEQIRKSEELYKLVVEAATDVFYIINLDAVISSLSKSFNKYTGWEVEQWIGKSFLDLVHPDDIAFAKEVHQTIISGIKPPIFEYRIRRKDGTFIYAEFSAIPLKDGEKITGVIGSAKDISARKLALEKLQQSENLYYRTINSMNVWVHVINSQLEVILINEALNKINNEFLKIPKITGQFIENLAPLISPNQIDDYKKILQGHHDIITEEFIEKENKFFYVEVKKVPIYTGSSVELILTTYHDITEQKMMEQRILRAIIETEEKERRRFAEDLHDGLGPLLSSIKLYINELTSNADANAENEELIKYTNELIDEAIFSTRSIANNLMPNTLDDYGLAAAIKSFCIKLNISKAINIGFNTKNLEIRLPKNVEITLYRIITELINNTIKHASAKNIDIFIERFAKSVQMRYADDGVGFSMEQTTGKYDSMGLNNIQHRLRSINGHIRIETAPNAGFKVWITIDLY